METQQKQSKWAPVTTDWRNERYEAVGVNGNKVVIVKGQQFDKIAKLGGKNPLARLIDSFQVYYELQQKIQALQDQVSDLTLQLEEAKKKAKKSWDMECEARRDLAFMTSKFKDRDHRLAQLQNEGVLNRFYDFMLEAVYDKEHNFLYYVKRK